VEVNWRVGFDQWLIVANLLTLGWQGREYWPKEGMQDGGRNLELEQMFKLEESTGLHWGEKPKTQE
jgi:hypothetical protein